MNRFPHSVQRAMRATGSAATCVAVRLDGDDWEAALFVQLAGSESEADRALIEADRRPLTVGMETDVVQHQNAAVVIMRLEIYANPADPIAAEILLTPGGATGHFDVLTRLSRQAKLCWFFGDDEFNVIHAQQHALASEQRARFEILLGEAIRHDAMVRCTGRYDAQAALAAVVSHYELRSVTAPPSQRARVPSSVPRS